MKNIKKNTSIFFFLGIIIFSLSIIINHYNPLSDFSHGLLKGSSIGFFILSLITLQRNRKRLAPIRTK
ncbi:MAG: hypothetical protein MUC49_06100 [Raineya sp.]|nr:hypothetical protein [Raineya sp.]